MSPPSSPGASSRASNSAAHPAHLAKRVELHAVAAPAAPVRPEQETPAAGGRHAARALQACAGLCLFVSGACALVYQTTWLRELRLVFGASTQASAATLAVFMGGLGAGAAWLGPRADRHPRPLAWYALLEFGIAIAAGISPFVLSVVRGVYLLLGGSSTMGAVPATLVRLVLAAFVVGVPALFMGGTLPAAARAVESATRGGRRRLASLYAWNTLGAVAGALLATFVLLERLGARGTLAVAAVVNLGVALVAWLFARRLPAREPEDVAPRHGGARAFGRDPSAAPRGLVLAAAFLTGFVFLLMELVWYRLLSPILGGSVFTLGLILAVALAGIAAGGALYARGRRRTPTLAGFAATCGLEALALAAPWALGDRLAVLALLLRTLGQYRFAGLVAGWGAICTIVVLPAATVAGYQFPLLIGLLGRGARNVGHDTGAAYAWNTAGAVAGSLAGGFALLPLLTASGMWRLSAALLAALSCLALVPAARRGIRWRASLLAALAAGAACALVVLPGGPSEVWRHGGIGAGRLTIDDDARTANDLERTMRNQRRAIAWQADGRESAIAIHVNDGMSLIVGGKSDGNIVGDAGTQIMLGLLGAFLRPASHRAAVIGLGTGSTAGWLGRVPGITCVDVFELEPAVAEMARRCAGPNQDPLANPRVHLHYGDGREYLLTGHDRYDLIVSEPSNPYRAGIASLYSREFYSAAAERLADGGLFQQWVQCYDIDEPTLRTIYATMTSVFPFVETWSTTDGDLMLVGSLQPVTEDIPTLRSRLGQEPYRAGVAAAWRVTDLEGVLARYVGDADFAREMSRGAPLNTDDRMPLEYAFGRSVGHEIGIHPEFLRSLAMSRGEALPAWGGAPWNMERVVRARTTALAALGAERPASSGSDPRDGALAAAYVTGDLDGARDLLPGVAADSTDLTQLAIVAHVLAEQGDRSALTPLAVLRRREPTEADLILAVLETRRGDFSAAAAAYVRACESYRRDAWAWSVLSRRTLPIAVEIAAADRSGTLAPLLLAALDRPFAGGAAESARLLVRVGVATRLDGRSPGVHTRTALDAFADRDFPWDANLLVLRANCYRNLHDPRFARAERELERFRGADGTSLVTANTRIR